MSEIRHPGPIPAIPFAAPAGTPGGVEVLTLSALAARARGSDMHAPQRPGFHLLLNLRRGAYVHRVDFTAHQLGPGDWLWVRPGQVQQWGDLASGDGLLVLFEAAALDPATVSAARLDALDAVPLVRLGTGAHLLAATVDLLAGHAADLGRLPLTTHGAVQQHLLSALVLALAHAAQDRPSGPQGGGEAYRRFRAAVEEGFARTRRVEDYARELGYSTRTLTRASLAGAGVGAKELIDRRVVLEAQRLLAHTDRPAARIASDLSFPSPTHFTRFFRERTGQAPLAFRATVRAS